MKKILLPLLFIVVLIGAGSAAVYFRVGPLAALADKIPFLNKPKTAADAAAPPPAPVVQRPVTRDVGSYVVPVIEKGQISREVGIDVAVVIAYSGVGEVNSGMARLQDNYTRTLFQYVPRLADPFSDDGKKQIHDKLMELAHATFNDDPIQDVVIKNVYSR